MEMRAYYWIGADQGSGSGADYAWGSNQLATVLDYALGNGGLVERLGRGFDRRRREDHRVGCR